MRSRYETFKFDSISVHVACSSAPQPVRGKTLTLEDQKDRQAAVVPPATVGASCIAPSQKDDLLGLDVWPASIALCKYLVAAQDALPQGQAIEIGAGTGLPGLLLAKLGGRRVVLSDYEPHVLQLLKKSAAVNCLAAVDVSLQRLDWSAAEGWEAHEGAYPLLLAADVVYFSAAGPPVAATIQRLLAPDGVALVAHQVRRAVLFDPLLRRVRLEEHDVPLQLFRAACDKQGLAVRVMDLQPYNDHGDTDDLQLLALAFKPGLLDSLPE